MLIGKKFKSIALLVFVTLALFQGAVLATTLNALSCVNRINPEVVKGGSFDALALLNVAMKKEKFKLSEKESVTLSERMMVSYYALKRPLNSIKDEGSRHEAVRMAVLMQNFHPIAAQMALGVTIRQNVMPQDILNPLYLFITQATEPVMDDPELADFEARVQKATQHMAAMTPKPLAFARWVVRAVAFSDSVAFNASMMGYCMSNPAAGDHQLLRAGYKIAKL